MQVGPSSAKSHLVIRQSAGSKQSIRPKTHMVVENEVALRSLYQQRSRAFDTFTIPESSCSRRSFLSQAFDVHVGQICAKLSTLGDLPPFLTTFFATGPRRRPNDCLLPTHCSMARLSECFLLALANRSAAEGGARWKTEIVPSLSPQYKVHVSPPAIHAAVAQTSAKTLRCPTPEQQTLEIGSCKTGGLNGARCENCTRISSNFCLFVQLPTDDRLYEACPTFLNLLMEDCQYFR